MDQKKLSEFILGCDIEKIRETVIMAPCWLPESVGVTETMLISEGACKIWDCKLSGSSFSYIVTGVGACNCADTVMALSNTSCKKILFIGSAGTIKKDISVGDIVLPCSFMIGEGASRYLQDKLETDTFGNVFSICSVNYDKIFKIAKGVAGAQGVSCHAGRVISVESIFSQFGFLDKFLEMGCQYIDMESSAFIVATQKAKIDGIVCFCISDNSMRNQSLVTVESKLTCFRKKIRRDVMPTVILNYIEV